MNNNRLVVSKETGEVVTEIREGDRIVRGSSIEHLENYQIWELNSFYKGNIDELKHVNRLLDNNERALLFAIIPYINYSDCLICHQNGREINQSDLVEITGFSRTQVYRILESLRKKDIIYKGINSKSAQYFANPWLFVRGNKINNVLKTMFKNYRIHVKGGKRWKDL